MTILVEKTCVCGGALRVEPFYTGYGWIVRYRCMQSGKVQMSNSCPKCRQYRLVYNAKVGLWNFCADVLADFLSQDARHTLSHVLGRAATRADKAGFTETAREFRDLARLVFGLDA